MKYALNIADDGRILSATFAKYAPADSVLVDTLPEDNISDYLYQDGEYVYSPLPEVEPTVEQQIAELKEQLSATDYKVIKCSEAQLAGEPMPYDVAELHTERQALRDKINELEGGLE